MWSRIARTEDAIPEENLTGGAGLTDGPVSSSGLWMKVQCLLTDVLFLLRAVWPHIELPVSQQRIKVF